MKQWNRLIRGFGLTLATLSIGSLFGGGCSLVGNLVKSINPCGTIIDCNPIEYDLLFRGVEAPDFEACPISVFPQDCVGVYPPTGGGGTTPVAPAPTPTTTTTTGGNTGGNTGGLLF